MLYPLSYECRFCCVPRVGLAHPATSSTVPRCRSGFAPFFGVTRAMECRPGWAAPHGDVGQEVASSTEVAHSSRAESTCSLLTIRAGIRRTTFTYGQQVRDRKSVV